jgi:hypothetical protein
MFYVFIFLALIATVGVAQEKDRVQVLVGFANSEIKNPIEAIQNSRTLTVDGKINVVNKSGFTFGPAFSYMRQYDVEVFMDSEIYPNGIYRDVDTYFGGVELAKKAGPLKFGGGFFLGTRKAHMDIDRELVRKYRGFVEIASGHFVIRPFFAEAEVTGGFNANRIHRYGAAGGFRF